MIFLPICIPSSIAVMLGGLDFLLMKPYTEQLSYVGEGDDVAMERGREGGDWWRVKSHRGPVENLQN